MRPFLIDTDTASDDAVALVMALRHPDIKVEAITVVAGNVPLDMAVQNALYTREISGADEVPVYAGCADPMLQPVERAHIVHGSDGMGDIGLPLTGRVANDGHAVDVIIELAHRFAGELTLVTLGPLTNVAVALLRDPTIATKIPRCVIMGGQGAGPGNSTPLAEFNIYCDPEAMAIVLNSGMECTFVGWDISTGYATIEPETNQRLRSVGTPIAHFCVDIQRQVDIFAREWSKLAGYDLPDPVAMAVALEPEIAVLAKRHVGVVWGEHVVGKGQLVIDWLENQGREPNSWVCRSVDRERFLQMLEFAFR
jgi:purine nucleosidase